MKRIRIVAAVVAVVSLAYMLVYRVLLADWAVMHFRGLPTMLHVLIACPAFCYASALLVGSLLNDVGKSRRTVRLVKAVNVAVLAVYILVWTVALLFPSVPVGTALRVFLGYAGEVAIPWAATLLGAIMGFVL